MNYSVELGGRAFTIALERRDGRLAISVDGEPLAADARLIHDHLLSVITSDGQAWRFTWGSVERTRVGVSLRLSGREAAFAAAIADPRRYAPRAETLMEGHARVAAPIAGKVIRLAVAVGEAVELGQPLLVLEAMKMQNEVRSPKAGVVTRFTVKPGDTVATGALLAELD